MFAFLRKMTEKRDKKTLSKLASIFAVGIAFILMAHTLFGPSGAPAGAQALPHTDGAYRPAAAEQISFERQLEARLEALFETVAGAGRVSVMVTLAAGREIVIAENITRHESSSKETDGQGLSREVHDASAQGAAVILPGRDGTNQPLILREIEPRVEGVIIVAQGGDDIHVADALIRATQTVLGIAPHKVQVLTMRADP